MTVRGVLRYPKHKETLRAKAEPIEDFEAEELTTLISDLKDTANAFRAEGLAAPQIGILKRVMVFRDEERRLRVLINPEIVERSEETIKSTEGCLSFPGVTELLTTRSEDIVVKAYDAAGEELTFSFDGMEAVAVQHEMDHLDGVLFIDHMSPLKKGRLLKASRKYQQKWGKRGFRPQRQEIRTIPRKEEQEARRQRVADRRAQERALREELEQAADDLTGALSAEQAEVPLDEAEALSV